MQNHTVRSSMLKAMGIFVTFLCMAASSSPAQSLPSAAIVTQPGSALPNFTAVYHVQRIYPINDAELNGIKADFSKWNDDLDKEIALHPGSVKINGRIVAKGYRLPTAPLIAQVNRNFQANGQALSVDLTLSQQGRKILVKTFDSKPGITTVWLYDGKNTIFGFDGSNANIESGPIYSDLNYFLFPGRGVGDISLAQSLSPDMVPGRFKGTNIVFAEGAAIKAADGGQSVRRENGYVTMTDVGGMPCVASMEAGTHDTQLTQTTVFSKYRNLGNGVVLPGAMSIVERCSPMPGLPERIRCITNYTLETASAASAPNFTPEGQFTKQTNVLDETGSSHISIHYKPGTPLSEQISDMVARTADAGPSQAEHNSAGIFGVFSLIFGVCGWYFWRRLSPSGRKGI